jgi:hypothetical protein
MSAEAAVLLHEKRFRKPVPDFSARQPKHRLPP